MADNAPQRILAIVRLKGQSDMARIARDVPDIVELFKRLSDDEMEQVFRSNDGQLFGFFMKTGKPIAVIRAEFEKLPATQDGDTILVVSIGEKFEGVGFSRALTWLQRH
jgi:hypothetical protein